eukprot:GEMP01058828.1.p1 GENE.GEMP01058828.1~~GEMP01058828.1.p1  ORF type:complete len:115 (+),score=2.91 GEMP01058828.1:757-1101(+)
MHSPCASTPVFVYFRHPTKSGHFPSPQNLLLSGSAWHIQELSGFARTFWMCDFQLFLQKSGSPDKRFLPPLLGKRTVRFFFENSVFLLKKKRGLKSPCLLFDRPVFYWSARRLK